jgi:hypothetical protein
MVPFAFTLACVVLGPSMDVKITKLRAEHDQRDAKVDGTLCGLGCRRREYIWEDTHAGQVVANHLLA